MQDPSTKRTFRLMIDTEESSTSESFFPSPRKKVKKGLSIEILDSFADLPNLNAKIFQLPQNSSFLAHKPPEFPLLSPRNNRNTPLSMSSFLQNQYSFRFDVEGESLWKSNKQDRTYDDFYLEGSYYDVTMRKCHRKTMEDRVI